jgi:hypothetical protein
LYAAKQRGVDLKQTKETSAFTILLRGVLSDPICTDSINSGEQTGSGA